MERRLSAGFEEFSLKKVQATGRAGSPALTVEMHLPSGYPQYPYDALARWNALGILSETNENIRFTRAMMLTWWHNRKWIVWIDKREKQIQHLFHFVRRDLCLAFVS